MNTKAWDSAILLSFATALNYGGSAATMFWQYLMVRLRKS